MSWSNPPDAVTAFRDMLLLCGSVTGAGFSSGTFHYPAAVLEGGSTATDVPCCVLQEDDHDRSPYAEGAYGVPTGTVSATFHRDTDAGTLEKMARDACYELSLVTQSSGLAQLRPRVMLASDPSPGSMAADSTETSSKFRSITITATYGLRI